MADDWTALSEWAGRLDGVERPVATITIRAPRERAQSSGAGAFLALADDGRQYWVKVPNNPQGNQVLVNEVIVGELGRVLGAPMRERALVKVPVSVTQWDDYPVQASTTPVLAHASLHVPSAEDADDLHYTKRDDNARRQAAIAALWDLCVGEDAQWLYDTASSYTIWSYDHGFWFATGEGDWNAHVLARMLAVASPLADLPRAVDSGEFLRMADAIDTLTPAVLLGIMSEVPVQWGTGDEDLEAMAWFLFNRRTSVAERLRKLAAVSSGGK